MVFGWLSPVHEIFSWIFQLLESRFLMWIRKETLHFFSTNFYILNLHDIAGTVNSTAHLICIVGELWKKFMTDSKRREIWAFFSKIEGAENCKCNTCTAEISCQHRNTTKAATHLKHSETHTEMLLLKKRQRESTDLKLEHTALKILTMYKLNKKLQSTTKIATVIRNYVNTLQAC